MKEPLLHAANWTHAGDIRPDFADLASRVDIRERIDACSKAGFRGMGFVFVDIENALARYSASDLNAMFADGGIEYLELEALMGWSAGDDKVVDDALRLAETIGAHQIKAVGEGDVEAPAEPMAPAFGRVCDRFADLGAKVVIELMQISNLDTLAKGRTVVEGAGRANGGLLFDSWHVTRCGIDVDEIAALPEGVFRATELCGVPREMVVPDRFDEMVDHRMQPDTGDFDNAAFVRGARSAGFDGPWGIEIVAAAHRALPVHEAVQRSADAMRAVLASSEAD